MALSYFKMIGIFIQVFCPTDLSSLYLIRNEFSCALLLFSCLLFSILNIYYILCISYQEYTYV